jgi:diguanylate cyclase (GGDEF)-like protein
VNERRKKGSSVTLLFLDLNDFKPINDQFGHDVGDEVLKKVALRLRQQIRKDDLLARLGGDEFAIVAYDFKLEAEIFNFAEKVVNAIAKPMRINDKELTVTGSLGIALFPQHAQDRAGLVKCADIAMYRSKMQGGGWHIYPNNA